MALNFKRIGDLLLKKRDESSLIRILVEYSSIKQKLGSPDNQSWYFKKGIESNKQRLVTLTKEYNDIRKTFNENTIDSFIERINKNLKDKLSIEKQGMNTLTQMHYFSILSSNEFFNELIRLKSKTDLLMPIDYYMENPEEFIKFIE